MSPAPFLNPIYFPCSNARLCSEMCCPSILLLPIIQASTPTSCFLRYRLTFYLTLNFCTNLDISTEYNCSFKYY